MWALACYGRPRLSLILCVAVARHPDQYLYMYRPIIPTAPPNLSDAPTYGNTLIGSTYAAVQARRTALGSALLGLERAGRLRSSTSTVPSPVELTQEGVPYYGNHNRLKNGARRGWAVGLWTKNREEWQVVDLACQAYGLVGVSLYETLGPDVAQYMWVGRDEFYALTANPSQHQSLPALYHLRVHQSHPIHPQNGAQVSLSQDRCRH